MSAETTTEPRRWGPTDPMLRNVCLCKKVTRGELIEAISRQQLFSLEQVREQTGANTGCGACLDGVQALIDQLRDELRAGESD
ncbi:(2Fe-2S)-binding protein [Marinobacterium arenosum]|uniref:(2Fe-2S)-binding protein n=1 Tax=Marinobacterium arenosum TaxID=2862496 RepID=UPI001C95B909|nr:(2Fe-2S)-binding protein [Marinobacterium arenosum]MBY4676001.1 (2Fe-2S)-binding protein [Marinobacterium arenosum]